MGGTRSGSVLNSACLGVVSVGVTGEGGSVARVALGVKSALTTDGSKPVPKDSCRWCPDEEATDIIMVRWYGYRSGASEAIRLAQRWCGCWC